MKIPMSVDSYIEEYNKMANETNQITESRHTHKVRDKEIYSPKTCVNTKRIERTYAQFYLHFEINN